MKDISKYTKKEREAISKFLTERAKMMNSARNAKMTPLERSESSRKAVKERWRKWGIDNVK